MKLLLNIFFVMLCSTIVAQEWQDDLNKANRAYKNKEYEKALKHYKSAQEKAPDDIDLSDEIAQSSYRAEDYESAQEIYQQNAATKSKKKERSNSYRNLGNSRMKTRDYQGAVDAYKDALRENPSDERTRYNLSEAIRKIKNEEQKKKKQNEQQNQQNQQQNQGNQGQQNQQSQQGQSGDNGDQQQNSQQGQQGQQNNQSQSGQNGNQQGQNQNNRQNQGGGGGGNQSDHQGQLPNKSVERILDELMKSEAETKRKISGNGGGGSSPKSGKDW